MTKKKVTVQDAFDILKLVDGKIDSVYEKIDKVCGKIDKKFDGHNAHHVVYEKRIRKYLIFGVIAIAVGVILNRAEMIIHFLKLKGIF